MRLFMSYLKVIDVKILTILDEHVKVIFSLSDMILLSSRGHSVRHYSKHVPSSGSVFWKERYTSVVRNLEPVRLGSTKKRMLLRETIGIESQSNEFPELEPFKMAGEELIEYLPYIYHPKMDSENEQSYQQVKTRRFVLDNKNKCQIKRNHSSTHVSLAASAILFRKLCRLFQISS